MSGTNLMKTFYRSPGSNTLAYFEKFQITILKSYVTLPPGLVVYLNWQRLMVKMLAM